VISFHSRWT